MDVIHGFTCDTSNVYLLTKRANSKGDDSVVNVLGRLGKGNETVGALRSPIRDSLNIVRSSIMGRGSSRSLVFICTGTLLHRSTSVRFRNRIHSAEKTVGIYHGKRAKRVVFSALRASSTLNVTRALGRRVRMPDTLVTTPGLVGL